MAAYCTAVATIVDEDVTVNPITVLLSLTSERTMPMPGATHAMLLVDDVEPTVGYCVVVDVVNLHAL